MNLSRRGFGFARLNRMACYSGWGRAAVREVVLELGWSRSGPQNFDPLPSGLVQLCMINTAAPPPLVAASAKTLTNLEFEANDGGLLEQLPPIASNLECLQSLSAKLRFSLSSRSSTRPLLRTLIALPALARLDLRHASTDQLEPVFECLPHLAALSHMATELHQEDLDQPRYSDRPSRLPAWLGKQLVPSLQRCARRLPAGGLREWRLSVALVPPVGAAEHVRRGRLQRWCSSVEGWRQFAEAVEAAGVRLVLGPVVM